MNTYFDGNKGIDELAQFMVLKELDEMWEADTAGQAGGKAQPKAGRGARLWQQLWSASVVVAASVTALLIVGALL